MPSNEIISNDPEEFGRSTSKPKSEKRKKKEEAPVNHHYLHIVNKLEIPDSLTRFHLIAATFQSLQSIVLFYVASKKTINRSVFTNFATDEDLGEDMYIRPNAELLGSLSISYYTAIFIMLASTDHWLCVLPFSRPKYHYYITRHQSPFKWVEYGFSASLMHVLISQLVGITDVHTLVCMFFISGSMIHFGTMHESMNAKARADGYAQNWFPFWASCVMHVAMWAIMLSYYQARMETAKSPGLLSVVIFVVFFLEAIYALVFYLIWAKIGRFADFMFGEHFYIILSFTAKTFLAWVTLAGGADRKYGASI